METEMHFEIPYIRLFFIAELLEDTILPETKAAALRGGMGMMLLRQNCVTDQNCGQCCFRESCVVTHTFYSHMTKQPPYVTKAGSVGYLIECRDRRTEYREGRIKLLKIICKKNAMIQISDSMLESLGERSIGMSPALIEGALNAAIREAIRTETTVTDQIMDEAFEKFNNGEEKQGDESELLKTARHEAGHAFICWYFGKTPSYLTIVARDHHGGYMQNSAEEKKGTYTKKELLDRIAVALGGRAAEIVYYGEEDGLTTGASGDLQAASAIAENMICSYGMYGNLYSGALTKNSAVANDIYASVNRIMEEQLQNAVSIIQNNRKAMDKLTEALLTGTHLNRDEINAVLEMFRIL